jgi:hypothetical protein
MKPTVTVHGMESRAAGTAIQPRSGFIVSDGGTWFGSEVGWRKDNCGDRQQSSPQG